MKPGIYPIIKSGVPDLELPFDRRYAEAEPPLWLRIGELLPIGTDVYSLEPSEEYMACRNLRIDRPSYVREYEFGRHELGYPDDMKEMPLVFAGRTALNNETIRGASVAGVLFRSGFRLGWVNITRLP